jgi:hypothetical protein
MEQRAGLVDENNGDGGTSTLFGGGVFVLAHQQ